MFVAGIWIYVTTTRARDVVGRYGLWALLALLALSYVASLFSGPPPTLAALENGGIVFGWLFVGGRGGLNKHRESVT